MTRLFVFGCSMSRYAWGTWADIIGSNFDEYYNYARGGSCNTLSMRRLFEANSILNFNKNDTVIIMLTGVGRHSYFLKNHWYTYGDLLNFIENTENPDPIVETFTKQMFDIDGEIYNSYTSILAIKEFLESTGIKHKFLLGMDISKLGNNKTEYYIKELTKLTENKTSLIDFSNQISCEEKIPQSEWYSETNKYDGHPSLDLHYKFIKNFLSEYDNETSKERYEFLKTLYIGRNQHIQFSYFTKNFHKQYNSAFKFPLFGQETGEL